MNTKVIIITNSDQLKDVNNSVKFDGFDNLQKAGFLIFADRKLGATNNLDDAEIVFVWDRSIGDGEIQNPEWWNDTFLPMKKEGEKWYVIHHTKGIQPQVTDSIILAHGIHVPDDAVYKEVCSILLDTEDNKKERIIKKVFDYKSKLNAVIEFLHACLNKSPDFTDFQKLKEAGYTDKLTSLEGELYSPTYFDSLVQLREKLFAWLDNFR